MPHPVPYNKIVSTDNITLVYVPEKDLEALKSASAELDALHAWGVDNWEGYGDALSDLEENGQAEGP